MTLRDIADLKPALTFQPDGCSGQAGQLEDPSRPWADLSKSIAFVFKAWQPAFHENALYYHLSESIGPVSAIHVEHTGSSTFINRVFVRCLCEKGRAI
jgi:hypothetical protein